MHKFIYQIHANVISPSQNFFGAMKTDSSEYSWLVDVEVDFFVSSLPNALQTRKLVNFTGSQIFPCLCTYTAFVAEAKL